MTDEYDPPLDAGIADFVYFLNEFKVETFESCEGGEGHAYREPTVRFHGGLGEGWRVLGLVLARNWPIKHLGRVWPVMDGEPTGPYWEVVFWEQIRTSSQPESKCSEPAESPSCGNRLRCRARNLNDLRCDRESGHTGAHVVGFESWVAFEPEDYPILGPRHDR